MQVSPLCAVCGGRCGLQFFRTAKGEFVCVKHQFSPTCHMCQTVTDVVSGPTISVCATCGKLAVIDNATAMRVARPVLDWLREELGGHRLADIPIEVGSLQSNALPPQNLGHCKMTVFGGQCSAEIFVASHQHPAALAGTLAHEYGHALLTFDPKSFQFRGSFNRDEHIDEGSCEVVRALWLEHSGTPDSKFLRSAMNLNVTPVYGDGFRMMWGEYTKIGTLSGFIDHVTGGNARGLNPLQARSVLVDEPELDGVIHLPIDQHRPTIRVIPPTAGVPASTKNPGIKTARPTIKVQPNVRNAGADDQENLKKKKRPTIRFKPPN